MVLLEDLEVRMMEAQSSQKLRDLDPRLMDTRGQRLAV
jgi:hypothetical protein